MSEPPPPLPPDLNEGWELDSNFDVQEYLTAATDAMQLIEGDYEDYEVTVPPCLLSPAYSDGVDDETSDVELDSNSWSDLSMPPSSSDEELAEVYFGASRVVPQGVAVPAHEAASLIVRKAGGGMEVYFLPQESDEEQVVPQDHPTGLP